MAKGKVTQDEFEHGLGLAEGLGAFRSSGVTRDNPFGKKNSATKPNGTAKQPVKELKPARSYRSISEDEPAAKKRNSKREPPKDDALKSPARISPPPKPSPQGPLLTSEAIESDARPRRFKDPTLEEVPFSFRYTYRETGDRLARTIQRRRKGLPGDRITAAMLYRVFAEIGLEEFSLDEGDLVATESELKSLVRLKLGLPYREPADS